MEKLSNPVLIFLAIIISIFVTGLFSLAWKGIKYFIDKLFHNVEAQQNTITILDERNEQNHEETKGTLTKIVNRSTTALEKNTKAYEKFNNAVKKCSPEET